MKYFGMTPILAPTVPEFTSSLPLKLKMEWSKYGIKMAPTWSAGRKNYARTSKQSGGTDKKMSPSSVLMLQGFPS